MPNFAPFTVDDSDRKAIKVTILDAQARYQKLGISDNLYQDNIIVTADTGFANEPNMRYLKEQGINAYIPDNQFRSRDPKFIGQKAKYGKRKAKPKSHMQKVVIPATAFDFDPIKKKGHGSMAVVLFSP